MSTRSICLFHNGNKHVVEDYKKKFSNLEFLGNWNEERNPVSIGKLWEISYADATLENLLKAKNQGICILRHVSTFDDDLKNLVPECSVTDYNNWINNIVSNHLITAEEIVSELVFSKPSDYKQIIITTGRTANKHFQAFLSNKFQINTFESNKTIDKDFLNTTSAVLMWREDQWEALTSLWIAMSSGIWTHRVNESLTRNIPTQVEEINNKWIENNWFNLCNLTFNQALFYKSVLKRPISLMTTERAVNEFQSIQTKIPYDKSKIIKNYQESKEQYLKSDTYEKINLLYKHVKQNIPLWDYNFENSSI